MSAPTPSSSLAEPSTPRPGVLCRAAAWTCALAAALGLVAFFVGRIASDRWGWTQYLHWLPSVPVIVACVGAALVSRLAWRRSKALVRIRRAVGCGLVLSAAWVLVFEWRVQHLIAGGGRGTGPALTFVHFNASGKPAPQVVDTITALTPDFVVFANLRGREGLAKVREAMGAATGGAGAGEGGASVVHADMFSAVSRYRIIEYGRTTLGFDGAVFLNRELPDLRDPGTAAWFRVDTRAVLGREIVVWAIDLPSDVRLARWHVMTTSMDVIERWELLSAMRQEGGNYVPGPAHEPGFPAPDVIIGDFNTPGGSAAIAEFGRRAGLSGGGTRRFVDAHGAAGLGPDASFPGFMPSWLGWGIDRALVSDEFAVLSRDLSGVGGSQHRAQRVKIAPAK